VNFREARKSIGQRVAYRARPGWPPEYGVITSVNTMLVFVRFDGDAWSKGCKPESLARLVK
jgi:hypothetical protein